jgi:plastocyanin
MRPSAIAILAGALVLAGCGSDEQSEPATRSSGEQLTVTETEFRLDPAEARVAGAGAVEVEVVNRGATVHALAIESGTATRSTGNIEPGQTKTLTADLPPGRYTWYCPVGDHRQRGMEGTLTVGGDTTEREPSGTASPSGGFGY